MNKVDKFATYNWKLHFGQGSIFTVETPKIEESEFEIPCILSDKNLNSMPLTSNHSARQTDAI